MTGGCSNELWLELAGERETDHPAEAIPIYQRLIGATLARTNNEAYREAIGFLRKVHNLMMRLDRESAFNDHLQSVRARFKAKRNFIKLLERARWVDAKSTQRSS